ncbi:hypothetical protein F5148DRAFT_1225368 [Russula earlei]|uniref:Uncharacterized protein n=1 Tax=Russula earlei TaxID=71964 RepID=A0ACC0U0T2_9AGAM|nr:hypothetical protein F5148DRAFT_1225368 [Russula earlei]
MRPFLYSLFLVPFTFTGVLAQQSNNAPSSSPPSVTVFTSFSTGISLSNRQTVAFTVPVTVTLTPNSSGNSAGNATNSTSSNSTSTQPTSTGPLPTAPTDVNGGGNAPGGAPSPGQSGQGGIYGPNDGYVSGVPSLQWNALVISIAGVIIGALLPLL